MPVSDCAAYLRVYEPLAAFDGEERQHWEAYVRDGCGVGRREGAALERAAGLHAVAGIPARGMPRLSPQAFVTELDGVTVLAPYRTRLRSLQALEQLRAELPDELVEAFLPRTVLADAEAELEQLRADRPDLRTHVLSSTWQVPVGWFVLVDAAEREVSLGVAAGGGPAAGARATGRELIYRTAMSRARRRAARALAVLRRAVDDGEVVTGVEELGRWLEEFHPRSLVELDYGGLADLLEDVELIQDESARDVAAALNALAAGDTSRAAAGYARVAARAKALQAVECAN